MSQHRAPPPRPLPMRPETIRTRARREAEAAEKAAETRRTKIFLEGLEIMASIGIYPHERETRQRILIDVELDLAGAPAPTDDRIAEVVDYEAVAKRIEGMARDGHVQLVETLAERILAWCLTDDRVVKARVRVAKPEALTNAHAAGCQVEATRT